MSLAEALWILPYILHEEHQPSFKLISRGASDRFKAKTFVMTHDQVLVAIEVAVKASPREQTDAFSAKSWDASLSCLCPHCGQHHRELGFFFPPSNLEVALVRPARSDGASRIFLAPGGTS